MKTKMLGQGLLILGLLLLTAACEEESGAQDADADADADAETGADADSVESADLHEVSEAADGAENQEAETHDAAEAGEAADVADAQEEEAPAPPPPLAITTNTPYDFSSGSYSVIRLDDMSVSRDIMSIHSDSVARCVGGEPFIVERRGADTITIVDREPPYSILRQFSIEAGSNPWDFDLLAAGRGVVARNNVAAAAVIDLADGALNTESLDLSGFADADGIPEAGAAIVKSGKIFIALQLLDRNTALWPPTGPGVVAVFDAGTLDPIDVDPVTDVLDGIRLTGGNPQPVFQTAPYDDGLALIAEVGFYGAGDGGIEGVDVETYEKTGLIVTEETLGGDIASWAVASADTGYATVSMPGFAGDKLVRFNPADGTLTTDAMAEGDAYTMTGMALTGDGRLLVITRAIDGSGVLVFDVETGERLTETPVSTGVSPFSICVF